MTISSVLFIIALVFVVATMATVLHGMFVLGQQTDDSRRKSNKLMQRRIYLQGFAVFLLLLAYLLK